MLLYVLLQQSTHWKFPSSDIMNSKWGWEYSEVSIVYI